MDDFELTKKNLEALLIEGIANGQVQLMGVRNGELAYGITEKGEKHIEELLGGVDVPDNAKRLMSVLVKYKILGFDVPKTFMTFLIIAGVLRIVKYYENWAGLTKILAESSE